MYKLLFFLFVTLFFYSSSFASTFFTEKFDLPVYDTAISFDGNKIVYLKTGNGKKSIVFVHGWSCVKEFFDNQKALLNDEYTAYFIDLAGHGQSSSDRTEWSQQNFAFDVMSVIEKEKIENPILVGHSMGSTVIALTAQLLKSKVAGLIVVDSYFNADFIPSQNQIDYFSSPFEKDFDSAVNSMMDMMFYKNVNPELKKYVHSTMGGQNPQRGAVIYRKMWDVKMPSLLKTINVPITLINGDLFNTNQDAVKKYTKHPKISIINGSGHFPMMEKPEEFNKAFLETVKFLESLN